jgi:predicted alpha/beta superfamily hydrolase
MREMRETLRATLDRVFRLEDRRRALRRGTLERIAGFQSRILGNVRDVTIYIPPGYERGQSRYPVLYMQDGQNLFEPQRAFIPGQHWRLNEAADHAIAERAQPMLIVGVDHAGKSRIDEYTPTRDGSRQAGGKADDYGRMLLEELKPIIDSRYRTITEDSAIGGSSLGGLASLYLGLTHSDVFRRLANMSPSVWWDGRAVLRMVDRFAGARPRIWLDVGGREGGDALRDARVLRDRLLRKGWSDANLGYLEDRQGDHSERAWSRRVRAALEFLFQPTP